MAFTESNMMPLGQKAPYFVLTDTVSNQPIDLYEYSKLYENGIVVMFLCNHCPYVIHVNSILVSIALEYQKKGIGFIAISSNDAEKYTEDSPDKMSIVAKVLQYPFPYCYDESQEIAKIYDAACTPDIYVFDNNLLLYYRGRIDESRPKNNIPLSGIDLKNALEDMLAGNEPPTIQYPSGGCNIKWKN